MRCITADMDVVMLLHVLEKRAQKQQQTNIIVLRFHLLLLTCVRVTNWESFCFHICAGNSTCLD